LREIRRKKAKVVIILQNPDSFIMNNGSDNSWKGQMRKLSEEEMKTFLSEPWVARIATLNEDGTPYLSTVWYEYDPPFFFLGGREKSAWVANLRRDPRVALHIAEDKTPFTRVVIEGVAEIVEGPIGITGRWVDIANKMATRYLGEHGPDYLIPTMNRRRYWVKIIPKKVTSWSGVEWHKRYL
jgi:PPOX class probable F420-dependent enzyme